MKTVYVESSIISFLRARPSGHVISAARQLITRRWWDEERGNYQLVISQYVIDEISKGNQDRVRERLDAIVDIPVVELPDDIANLAEEMISAALLPPKARVDALHICVASIQRLDYLLTWNCTHIANARILPRVEAFLSERGHLLPLVCTPEELLDDEYPIT
ncbi:MAG TPA: type II toxin-antitoxin system VapC family toxin [Planctomycetaceae bacterium]|nr:type II toxin-antitoxin system VapC family toxin [Planctomycetaceae bacterium]